MAIMRRNPIRDLTNWGDTGSDFFSGLSSLQREMDRLLGRFQGGSGNQNEPMSSGFVPPVDIVEHDNEFIVKAEIPGVKKEDVKITIDNDVLTIRGQKTFEKEVNEENYHRIECASGSFQRSFALPHSVRPDQIEASYDSGILTVVLPKSEESKPKQIDVKVR